MIIGMQEVQLLITAVNESQLSEREKEFIREKLDRMQDILHNARWLNVEGDYNLD